MKKKPLDAQSMIVYEDEDYLVINKPAFLSTLADRSSPNDVLSLFRERDPNIQVCHRLDKETSGALLLSKNDEAFRHATMQFQNREVEKVYHALVEGHFPENAIQVDVALRVTGSGRAKPDKRLGKEAITLFRLKETVGKFSIVEAKPITGRTHQIRAHLAYIEYPICGDEFYGGQPIFLSELKKAYKPKEGQEERSLLTRVALHAHSISFLGMKKNNISILCDYPKNISDVITKIEKFGR